MEQEKGISTDLNTNNQSIASFFDKDPSFAFVYKKTEKLASAVYMITNLFSDSEPMKWTLRKKVSEILSFMINHKDVSANTHSEFSYSLKTKAFELVSLLEVSLRGGLVSNMNFSILKSEFTALIEFLDSSTFNLSDTDKKPISKEFFAVDESNLSVKDRFSSQSQNVKDINILRSREQFKRSNRQNIILNLLKKKSELTIKDISVVIIDCSEKTIQRELNSFITAGILKRTGERRWSKYSLAGA